MGISFVHLRKVLKNSYDEKLLLKRSKCGFGNRPLLYLGNIIGAYQLKIDSNKVRAIMDWPSLGNVIEIRSFCGIFQCLRKFIIDFLNLLLKFT